MSDRDSSSDSGSLSDDLGSDVEPTIAQDIVVTKYNMAAGIANTVLTDLIGRCSDGASVIELCEYGDQQLVEKTGKVFKKEKDVKKGIAFPTCISVNNVICHYSPLKSEPNTIKLATGDVVKIDLGAHVDGFIATVAHTIVVGASEEEKVTGRKADVILAAYNSLEAAIRMLRPGQHKSNEVTDMINKICDIYETKPVENMLSFQLKRNQIGSDDEDITKQIIQNPSEEMKTKVKKVDFCVHEVYAIDVLVSSGEGKGREMDTRTTVYKRKENLVYQLKMKASRMFLSDADKRCGQMPFSLRHFEDEKKAKLGIVECERHELMKPFKVMYERENEYVAQFKATVLVMSNGLLKITGLPLLEHQFSSEHSIEDESLKKLISASLKPSKKKNKGGAAAAKPVTDAANGTAPASKKTDSSSTKPKTPEKAKKGGSVVPKSKKSPKTPPTPKSADGQPVVEAVH